MKLTSENVETIFMDCLFEDKIDENNIIHVNGIVAKFGLNKIKVEKHKDDIYDMLKQLPKEFQIGWSFLNACMDKDGNQWTGLHRIMEQLFVLGIAAGKAKFMMPKELWMAFPGGMPYLGVL
jgi:hypothetical protein